jgi:hypothetical protein
LKLEVEGSKEVIGEIIDLLEDYAQNSEEQFEVRIRHD